MTVMVVRKIGGAQLLCERRAPSSACELVSPIAPHIPLKPPWSQSYNEALAERLPEHPTLSMGGLARQGRWGNAFLQYAFLRTFAKVHNFQVQTPNWIGRRLCQLTDRDMSARLPAVLADGCSAITNVDYHPFAPF